MALEEKFETLTATNTKLEERIKTLEAETNANGAILTSLPAIQDIVAQNTAAFNNWIATSTQWTDNAEKVMEWNHNRYTALDERLKKEEEFRNYTPKTEWEYQRLFSIMASEHGLLQADHFTICYNKNRGVGAPDRIRSRRDYGSGNLDPNTGEFKP